MPGGRVAHPPAETRFIANLNLAIDTQYTPPADCPELDGAATVQAAIDRLVGLLPRLYHVSGDGLEGAVGEAVVLRAGIANRCGGVEPRVRFELKFDGPGRRDVWRELDTVPPDAERIASFAYELGTERRQVVRARMIVGDRPLGDPVYFNLGLAGAAVEGVVPSARLEIAQSGQIAAPAARTIVEFRDNSVRFDLDGMFDPGADPTRLRATRPGTYVAAAELTWDNTNGDGVRVVEIHQNGEPIGKVTGPALPRGADTVQQVTAITRMQADEVVQLIALHGARAEVVIDRAVLSLAWLGP